MSLINEQSWVRRAGPWIPAKAVWLVVGTSHQGPDCSPESESTNKSSFCSDSGSRVLLGLGCKQSLLSLWGEASGAELTEQSCRRRPWGGSDTPGLGDSDRMRGLPCRPRARSVMWEDRGGPRGPVMLSSTSPCRWPMQPRVNSRIL